MISARDQGHVEILRPCQTMDPARGSFMVNPATVKKKGTPVTVSNPYYDIGREKSDKRLHVFRAANAKIRTRRGWVFEEHPYAFDFAVYY